MLRLVFAIHLIELHVSLVPSSSPFASKSLAIHTLRREQD